MKICESDKSSSEMNIIFEWMTEVERKTSTTRLVGGCLAWMLLVMFAISGIAMDTEFAFDLFFWTTILGMGVGGILWIGVRSSKHGKTLLGLGIMGFPIVAMDSSSSIAEMILYGIALAVVIGTVPFLIRFFNVHMLQSSNPTEPVNLTTIRDRIQCFDDNLTKALCLVAMATVAWLVGFLVLWIREVTALRNGYLWRLGFVDSSSFFADYTSVILLTCCSISSILWIVVLFRRSFQTRRFTMNAPKPLREPLIPHSNEQEGEEEKITTTTTTTTDDDDAPSDDNGTDVLLIV